VPQYSAATKHHTMRAGEQGSIVMVLLVMMVATMLIVAVLATTEIGLRSSRRAGDSANALQLADAGINDAAKAITAHTTSFTGTSSVGTAGSYSYTATKDGIIWHLDATGTDTTGIKRRILADAVDQPIFSNAFFAQAGATIKGTADSYTSPTNTCATSPASGVIGSNGTITFTGGTGARNCRGASGWAYPVDGCTFYGQTTIPPDANGNNAIGAGACPPAPATTTTTQKFFPPPVTVPSGLTSEGAFTCPTDGTIPSGTHLYTSITLSGGCQVAGTGPAVLYATGPVTLGTDSGNCKSVINAPPGLCGGSFPSTWYQTGWPAKLQLNVAGNGSVSFANHAIFWGVIDAPNSLVTASGGGTPQVDVFGSVVAASATSAAQFAFHFDLSLLQQLTTGQYRVINWREEPIS
jgi:Tfp pilus assembly protein PilX